jgi:hypothetical protein
MKTVITSAALVTFLALGGTAPALANDSCGMNSNKPCPEKLTSKEPAYKSMNSNKPAAQRSDSAAAVDVDVQAKETPARTDVKAKGSESTPARATLTGVKGEDLKVKPKAAPTHEKETAD